MPQQHRFRLKLFFPLVLVSILMSAITLYIVLQFQKELTHQSKEVITGQFELFLKEKTEREGIMLSEYIALIQAQKNLVPLFQDQKKDQLYTAIRPTFERLNGQLELTHMYFITPEGKVLLRVHDFDRDGDTVERYTFIEAQQRHSVFHGLEFGLKKNYTLRVVAPWYVDGKLIGYLELGKEIDRIMAEFSELMHTEIYLAVRRDFFRDDPAFVQQQLQGKAATKKYYIDYATAEVPPQLLQWLEHTFEDNEIQWNGKDYFITRVPLSDVSGSNLGWTLLLCDESLEHQIMHLSIRILSLLLGVLSLMFLGIGYWILKKKEKAINTLTAILENQREKLSKFNSKLQKLFDLQKTIIVVTDGKVLSRANKAMFDFFGYDDLDGFLKEYHCICDHFLEHANFFHLKRLAEGENWVHALSDMPQEARMVAMADQFDITHIFSVQINHFDDQLFIITFSDISDTMLQQLQLMQKVTHDPLTGAYNREFFYNNIERIIHAYKPLRLGCIVGDIDHFKRINDTYGHNRGDIVLQHIVTVIERTIRSSDYLIRWGGEEFVILMPVQTPDALCKAAEHLREIIEKEPCQVTEQITLSFGATLHEEDEPVMQSIERADQALYQAKSEGRNRVVYR